jgi:hypothetical protein
MDRACSIHGTYEKCEVLVTELEEEGGRPLGRNTHKQQSNKSDLMPFKLKLDRIIFKNTARTAKKTTHFTIAKINWLNLFKEIIAVYIEKAITAENEVTDC